MAERRIPGLGRIATGGRGRRLLAAVALTGALAIVITVVLSSGSPSSTKASGDARPTGAATVRRRNLVETDAEAGTLSYSGPQTVYDRLSGTITWLPSVGQLIRPGGILYRVDGEPVILLNGSTPAYRTLTSSDSDGADITQLNRNLVALGFNPDGITVDDVWQPGTTTGVELLQESFGEAPTGSLPLGQVVFLPGAQLVATVDGTLGATGSAGGSPAQPAGTDAVAPAPEFVSLHTTPSACPGPTTSTTSTTATTSSTTTSSCTTAITPTTTTPSPTQTHKPGSGGRPGNPNRGATSGETLAALTALLKAESAQLRAQAAQLKAERAAASGGHRNSANINGGGSGKSGSGSPSTSGGSGSPSTSGGSGDSSSSGSTGGSGQAVLQTTSTHLVVTVDLAASSQREAKVGERVTVEMPAGNIVNGRITAVSPVAQSSSASGNGSDNSGGGGTGGGGGGGSGGASSTIPVTITLSGHHTGAGLDQASVSVNFAQQRADNVLSVPVTALLATSGGNYAVQEAAAPHQLIPVTTGLFAAGYVQISGPGLYPGLQVTDSQG